AVVRDSYRIETKSGERRRGSPADVELDDRRLDRRPISELDDVIAAFSRARANALRASVLAHVDAGRTKSLREKGRASRVIGGAHLSRTDEGRADPAPSVHLLALRAGGAGSEDRDAPRKLAEARSFFVRPEARLCQALDLRRLRHGAARDDYGARLERARAGSGAHDHLAGSGDLSGAAHGDGAHGLVSLDVPRVVGIVA